MTILPKLLRAGAGFASLISFLTLLSIVFAALNPCCLWAADLAGAGKKKTVRVKNSSAIKSQSKKKDNSSYCTDYVFNLPKQNLDIWPQSKMPLKVFVEPAKNVPGYRPRTLQLLKEACRSWTDASKNLVRFEFVNERKQANICVRFSAYRDNKLEKGKWSGLTIYGPAGDEYKQMNIVVLTKANGIVYGDNEMRGICLHELGHALGISGHSPFKEDCMYPVDGGESLSYRDCNTILFLYQNQDKLFLPLFRRAIGLLNSGDCGKAFYVFEELLAIDTKFEPALEGILIASRKHATKLFAENKTDESCVWLERAIIYAGNLSSDRQSTKKNLEALLKTYRTCAQSEL